MVVWCYVSARFQQHGIAEWYLIAHSSGDYKRPKCKIMPLPPLLILEFGSKNVPDASCRYGSTCPREQNMQPMTGRLNMGYLWYRVTSDARKDV